MAKRHGRKAQGAPESISASFRRWHLWPKVDWMIEGDVLLKNGRAKADLSQVTRCSVSANRKTYRAHENLRVRIESSAGNVVISGYPTGFAGNGPQNTMRRFSARVLEHIASRSPDAMFRARGPFFELRFTQVPARHAMGLLRGSGGSRAEQRRRERKQRR